MYLHSFTTTPKIANRPYLAPHVYINYCSYYTTILTSFIIIMNTPTQSYLLMWRGHVHQDKQGGMVIFSTHTIQMVARCSSIHHVHKDLSFRLTFYVIRLSLTYLCVWPSFVTQTARKKATSSNQPFRVSAEKCVCGHSPHPSFGVHVSQRSPDQPGSQLMHGIERERESHIIIFTNWIYLLHIIAYTGIQKDRLWQTLAYLHSPGWLQVPPVGWQPSWQIASGEGENWSQYLLEAFFIRGPNFSTLHTNYICLIKVHLEFTRNLMLAAVFSHCSTS